LNTIHALSSIPIIGTQIRHHYLFDQYSLSYDILVNFVEAHEEASHMLQKVIENQKYLSRILNESQENMNHAENYMHQKIEEMYPEICKAIQHRRAQYFLLVHEYHYVEKMMKNG